MGRGMWVLAVIVVGLGIVGWCIAYVFDHVGR